jgi:hypothetical protein
MKKLTILLFVLIFTATLIFTACGEKQPEQTELPTHTDATTTTAAITTTKATTTKATTTKATTTTAAPTTTTVPVTLPPVTRAPIPVTPKVENPDDYRALYVQDGAMMLMDFYAATPDMEVMNSLTWNDETEPSSTRFTVPGKFYVPYIWYVYSSSNFNKYSALAGGTCDVKAPYFYGSGAAKTTVDFAEDFYTTLVGNTARNVYESYFGDKWFGLGFHTTLSMQSIARDFGKTQQYTVQVFGSFLPNAEKPSISKQMVFMFGVTRMYLNVSEVDVAFSGMSSYSPDTKTYTSRDVATGDFYEIEGYKPLTFTIGVSNYIEDGQTHEMGLDLYINTRHQGHSTFEGYAKSSDVFKIGEGADSRIHAIRVYNKVLTQEEVKQNHFADMALYFSLDIKDFAKLSDAKKTAAYDALSAFDSASDPAEVAAAYAAAIK